MNWKIFRLLFFAIFSSMLGQGIVLPLLPVYANTLGATGLYMGAILGAYPLAMALFLPFIGRLSDSLGRKPFIVSGLLAYFAVSVMFLLSEDLGFLILVRFLQGAASAMILPVAEAYAGEITPEGKEGMVMGLAKISFSGGLCAGPLIGGVAKDTLGIQASFLIMGGICLVCLLLCALFLPAGKKERISERKLPGPNYRILLKDRSVAGLCLLRFAYNMCIGAVWLFLPLIADTEYGLSALSTGVLVTLSILVSTALMIPTGLLADRIGKRSLLAAGSLMTLCAITCLIHAREAWGLYVACFLFGAGEGISLPALMAMAVVLGRRKASMGGLMSLQTLSQTLGMVAGSLLAGGMKELFSLGTIFGGGAALLAMATALALFLTSEFQVPETGKTGF